MSKIITIEFSTHKQAIEAESILRQSGRWTDINRINQEDNRVSFEVQDEEVDDYSE